MTRTRAILRTALVAAAALATASVLAAASVAPATAAAPASASVAAAKSAPATLDGLRVLITNDDSMRAERPNNSDGLGLYEIRRALCAAGADVVVIAPWQVQSGRGTAVSNSGVLNLGTLPAPAGYEADCAEAPAGGAVYGLCLSTSPCGPTSPSATPVDTIKFATRGGLLATVGWHEPDLVVSGINSGNNTASSVSDSGTVGAAMAALEEGIPAVAFSSSGDSSWNFPVVNYRANAEWGARFLAGLRGAGLLEQTAFGLNVNYPNVAEGAVAKPAVWTSVGTSIAGFHTYAAQADGSYKIVLTGCVDSPRCEDERSDADILATGPQSRISVTPLTWDRTYGYKVDGQRELAKVRKFVEHDAPRP